MDIGILIGKTLVRAEGVGNRIVFETADGEQYALYHEQNCCESVEIEDIAGDLADLVGSPILKAEEVAGGGEAKVDEYGYMPESFTWSFYHLATIKGYVTIRWYGTSNGYYSESVTFAQV